MNRLVLCYFHHEYRDYTPVDLGYIKTLTEKQNPGAQVDIVPVVAERDNDREKTRSILEQRAEMQEFECADRVIFFLDNILWSTAFYLGAVEVISQKLKEKYPNIQIGMQSYKLKDESLHETLGNCPWIDFIVRGEPEAPIATLYPQKECAGVPGISYIDDTGELIIQEPLPDREDLDSLPSPYLEGVFDADIEEDERKQFFMYTARGCPFRCHYCFRSVKFSKVRTFSIQRVLDEIEYMADRGVRGIFMLDDCFIVSHKRFYDLVEAYQERFAGRAKMPRIQVMARPELLNKKIIWAFQHMNIDFLQMGLQTVHPDAQFLMGRGCDLETFRELIHQLHIQGIRSHLDVIIGLPFDDLDHCLASLEYAFSLNPSSIQIKQLFLQPNTLFDLYPERYGIVPEVERRLYNMPFVKETNTFSNDDIRKASEFANSYRGKLPHTKMKLVTQFHRFSDYR